MRLMRVAVVLDGAEAKMIVQVKDLGRVKDPKRKTS